ncbi:MAG: EF-hand domain-containing protein [Rhodocyclaceae bacterium]|nr:EF-hand domain-containing protein [Rhodocyclaceae bacterium]
MKQAHPRALKCLLGTLCVAGSLALSFGAHAADNASKAGASKPGEVSGALDTSKMDQPAATTIAPGKSETADSAFLKLDIKSKGYVTKDDTKVLEGFDKSFTKHDDKRDGKLSLAEFRKAWSMYTGQAGPTGPSGAAADDKAPAKGKPAQ